MTNLKTRIGLVQFLGSNCDVDTYKAFWRKFGIELIPIWHTETTLPKVDGLILPGGFSYGDFLRGGALASHSKIMGEAVKFAERGGAVLGICNGFQVLTELQLLPGALIRNDSGLFVCDYVDLDVGSGNTGYHRKASQKESLRIPVAHGEGRYFVSPEDLKVLQDNDQILFRYRNNPNGSTESIAGVISKNGRVVGMMPHPERAVETRTGGSDDGMLVLEAFVESCL